MDRCCNTLKWVFLEFKWFFQIEHSTPSTGDNTNFDCEDNLPSQVGSKAVQKTLTSTITWAQHI